MKTTGGTLQLARGTRFLVAKTKTLILKMLKLDNKQITLHPKLPFQHRTFFQPTVINDFSLPELGHDYIFDYERSNNRWWTLCLFVICFGLSDFLTRVQYDQAFSHRFHIWHPEQLFVIDEVTRKYRGIRDKYLNYLGENILSDYDYNIKKEAAVQFLTNKTERDIRKKQQSKQQKQALEYADKYLTKLEEMIEDKDSK